jgi:AraC family transcriptional regulator
VARTKSLEHLSDIKARQLMNYIHANLDSRLNLVDLAEFAHLSPRQFFRIFSTTFGATPHRYIINERVAQAKELIAKGRLLVEIAIMLGFANQSHFSRVFRKATGMSPGQFRKNHHGPVVICSRYRTLVKDPFGPSQGQ